MATVGTSYIELDDQGIARIAGTTTKVREVLSEYKYWGWTPDIIHKQHPYLSLAQIHAAFVYYYDHQQEIDSELEQDEQYVDQLAQEAAESPLQKKLSQLKEKRS